MKLNEFQGETLVGQLVLIDNSKIRRILKATKMKVVVKMTQDPNDARFEEWSIKTNRLVGYGTSGGDIKIISEAEAISIKKVWSEIALLRQYREEVIKLANACNSTDVLRNVIVSLTTVKQ